MCSVVCEPQLEMVWSVVWCWISCDVVCDDGVEYIESSGTMRARSMFCVCGGLVWSGIKEGGVMECVEYYCKKYVSCAGRVGIEWY